MSHAKLMRAVLLATALVTPALADATFKPETFKLDNGMQVVVIPDHRAPVVTHQVWFRTGSTDDPRNAGGIAHFFEHLMFRGTPKVPDGQFDALITRKGGENNANTSYDRTCYYERVAKESLGLMMELDADRMQNLVINDKTVTSERQVILEERNQRTDNEPESLFFEQMNAALFVGHTYGIPVIGWRSEIENLTTEEARAFYDANYGPNNAILVVAGDVTADEVKTLATQHYGPMKPRTLPPRVRVAEPPAIAARRVAMKDPRVGNPAFVRMYLAPSYTSQKDGEAYALSVMAFVMGGRGDNSRLGLAMIKGSKIATSVSAWHDGDGLDDRSVGFHAVPAEGHSLAEMETAIDAEIAKFIAEGPTPEELARAKTLMVANFTYAQDSQEGLANYYGEGLALGQSLDDLAAWPQRIEAVTADQVKAVAAKYLVPQRSVSGTLEPEAKPAAPVAGGQP